MIRFPLLISLFAGVWRPQCSFSFHREGIRTARSRTGNDRGLRWGVPVLLSKEGPGEFHAFSYFSSPYKGYIVVFGIHKVSNCFKFHAVFEKIWRNRILALPPPPAKPPPLSWYPLFGEILDLPLARNEQGNIFRSMCQKFCSQGGLQAHTWGKLGVWLGGDISRPTPRGEVGGSGQRDLQAHTWGISRPTLGGDVSQHALRQTLPPFSRWLLLWAVRILLKCILV